MGDVVARAAADAGAIDISSIEPQIVKLLAPLSLSPAPHWIKIIYAQMDGAPTTVEVSLDNAVHAGLTTAVQALPWPKQPGFYMTKQFIVVK